MGVGRRTHKEDSVPAIGSFPQLRKLYTSSRETEALLRAKAVWW